MAALASLSARAQSLTDISRSNHGNLTHEAGAAVEGLGGDQTNQKTGQDLSQKQKDSSARGPHEIAQEQRTGLKSRQLVSAAVSAGLPFARFH
jgi:hypothetical protein